MKKAHGKQVAQEVHLYALVIGELATWIGASFIWPLTSVYLNKQLHVSLTMIGWVLFFNCAGNILGSTIAGRLFDKFNPYPLIVAGIGLDALVLFLLALRHGWPEYGIWLLLTGTLAGWNGALINSIGTSIKKHPSRYVFNILYFFQNLGVVLGTLIVGYLYQHNDQSVTLLFTLAGGLFVIALINAIINYRPIVSYHRNRDQVTNQATEIEKMPLANFKLTLGFYLTLGIIWLMYMNWESNLSVYMVSLGIKFERYSLLWTMNATEIVIIQAILVRFPGIFKKLIYQIWFGTFMFAISFLTLLYAKTFTGFAISMIILTMGEATAMPAMPAFVNDLSPYSSKGKYQGLTLVAQSVGRALGPLVGGFMIDSFSYQSFFVFAFAIIFIDFLALFPLYHRQAKQIKFFK